MYFIYCLFLVEQLTGDPKMLQKIPEQFAEYQRFVNISKALALLFTILEKVKFPMIANLLSFLLWYKICVN